MTADTTRRKAAEPPEDGSKPLHNVRWEAFCIAYTGHFRRNGAASYVAAGYKPKTPDIAASNAERLLRNADIQNRVKYLNDEALKAERLHARDAVHRLAVIATATLADFMDENGDIDPATLSGDKAAAVESVTKTANGYCIRLKDDMRALELLGLTEKSARADVVTASCFVIEV